MVPFFPHQVVWEVYKEAGMLFCLFIAIACTLQWKWLSHASFLLPFSYFSISGRLEKWADRNLTQFKKNKCRVLWLGRTPSMNQARWGPAVRKAAFQKRTWGPGGHNVERELAMCPCHQELQWHPGLPAAKYCQRWRELLLQGIRHW